MNNHFDSNDISGSLNIENVSIVISGFSVVINIIK